MAGLADMFSEQERTNWLKGCIGLNIAKHALEVFVDREVKDVHTRMFQTVRCRLNLPATTVCTNCCTANLLKCPTQNVCKKRGKLFCMMHDSTNKQPRPCKMKICDEVRDEIIKQHRYDQPSWKNTAAEQWESNHWQLAKCFLPPDGYTGVGSAHETDFNGIISIMLNCKHFDSKVSFSIAPPGPSCLLSKAKELGRVVRHNSDCKMNDSDLQNAFSTLIGLLSDPTCLAQDIHTQEAISKIIQLQVDSFKITLAEKNQLLKNARDTLNEMEQVANESIKEMTYFINNFFMKHAALEDEDYKQAVQDMSQAEFEKMKKSDEEEKRVVDIIIGLRKREIKELSKELDMSGINILMNTSEDAPSLGSAQDRLQYLLVTHGRKSNELKSECEKISKKIRDVHGVVDVYSTVHGEKSEARVVFVVSHTGENLKQYMDEAFKGRDTIDYVTKAVDCFQTCNVAESEDIQEQDEEMLRLCIRKISKGLYVKHSRLSFIQGCIINLTGAYELRLVFYVHAKGYIPIDEDPFEKSYEGIPVSVREGSFVPFGKHATDFHDHIRMGCQIEGKSTGTLGVFLEHSLYGKCGITCAHVLMDERQMRSCINRNGNIRFLNNVTDNKVWQPNQPHDIGKVKEIFVKENLAKKPGVDIAIVQLQERLPRCGRFPVPKQTSDFDYQFTSGRVFDKGKPEGVCWKFGSVTDYTRGKILKEPISSFTIKTKGEEPLIYELYDQIMVRSIENKPFAQKGDSGGPVFVHDSNGEIVCIGIVVGGYSDVALVTPISSIMQVLGASQLLSFSPPKIPTVIDVSHHDAKLNGCKQNAVVRKRAHVNKSAEEDKKEILKKSRHNDHT